MKKIVFDVMNNDNGYKEAIQGALAFMGKNKDYQIALVGDKKLIEKEIKNNTYLIKKEDFIIIDSPNLATINSSIRDVLKKPSSMLDAFNYLNENDFDAILSSGDSGSFISLATLKTKRLPNVFRPAFMPILPTMSDHFSLLLDAGANIDTPAQYINNWAIVASKYFELIFKKFNPSIGLLNVGTEEYKGSQNIKNAYTLLKENKKINFYGFIEPNDAIAGKVDIILAEGQQGNIFLKTLESSFINFGKLLKKIIYKNIKTKIAGLFLKNDLKKFKEKFDYRNIGGAYIIGLEKIVVKAHGGSDELAFENALNQIKLLLEKEDFIKNLSKQLGDIENNEI
ncbi:phosphate acyltransferase PlsX [Mycoplasma sp. 3398]